MKNKLTLLISGLLVVSCVSVFAGTDYSGYNTTVGRYNGSGYTGYQTKVTRGADADLMSVFVGGSYMVDARMIDSSGSKGSWSRDISDNDIYSIDGSTYHKKDDKVRIQFSNDISTPVNVQVTGNWRSN